MSTDGLPGTRSRKHACEPCKARKVRCNGEPRCQQCAHSGLPCIYRAPKERAKTYQRGTIISAWRAEQRQGPSVIAPAILGEDQAFPVQPRPAGPSVSQASSATKQSVVSSTSAGLHNGPMIDETFVLNYLPDYTNYVYPFHPIIPPAAIHEALDEAASNIEARAFLFALAAVTINLTRSESVFEQVRPWIHAAMKLQQPLLGTEEITVRRIMTVQWCHVCLMGMKQHGIAYFYLRQALTMLQLLEVDKEQHETLKVVERAQRQRLYHLMFIHERFLALAHQRSILLAPLPQLAIIDTSIPPNVDHGFRQITRLFMHVDEDLLSKWSRSDTERHAITPEWIEAKHQAIENESVYAFEEDMGLTEFQLADLIITKHWLHMLLWQIAVSQCLLSSSPEEHFMTLAFPVRISSQLRTMLATSRKEMFRIHGTAMQSKLFEITDTIGNVLITVPAPSAEIRAGRISDFLFLLDFLSSLPRSDPRQRDVLEGKLATMQDMFPAEV